MGALVMAGIFAFIVGWVGSIYPSLDQPQSEINIPVPGPGPGYLRAFVNPDSEINKNHLVKQEYDYSCGSAALAILLNYYLGENFTEKQVINGLLHHGDADQIAKRQAFSLLDMKKFVKALGYQGEGYKLELEDLYTLDKPCILPIKIFEYRHFVVFKGIYKGHVFLADPWRGDISFTLADFNDSWYDKVVFMVETEGKVLSNLRLREEDLRFIDEDEARQIIFGQKFPSTNFREYQQIVENPLKYEYYKQ